MMNSKLLTSVLGLAVLLVSAETVKAGDIKIQTNNTRVFVGTNGNIRVQAPGANVIPSWRRSPSFMRIYRPWWNWQYREHGAQATCHQNSYSYNDQRRALGQTITQTYSSTSTVMCR